MRLLLPILLLAPATFGQENNTLENRIEAFVQNIFQTDLETMTPDQESSRLFMEEYESLLEGHPETFFRVMLRIYRNTDWKQHHESKEMLFHFRFLGIDTLKVRPEVVVETIFDVGLDEQAFGILGGTLGRMTEQEFAEVIQKYADHEFVYWLAIAYPRREVLSGFEEISQSYLEQGEIQSILGDLSFLVSLVEQGADLPRIHSMFSRLMESPHWWVRLHAAFAIANKWGIRGEEFYGPLLLDECDFVIYPFWWTSLDVLMPIPEDAPKEWQERTRFVEEFRQDKEEKYGAAYEKKQRHLKEVLHHSGNGITFQASNQ